jgi:hypothetical protein
MTSIVDGAHYTQQKRSNSTSLHAEKMEQQHSRERAMSGNVTGAYVAQFYADRTPTLY